MKIITCSFILFFSLQTKALALKINIADTGNLNQSQIEKLKTCTSILDQVLNSPEFKERVLAHEYQGAPGYANNDGLSNLQIYERIMKGAEQFPTVTPENEFADIKVKIYYPPFWKIFSRALAFTSPEDPYLNFHKRYFKKASLQDLSNTIFHEWTHKLGFEHDYNATARRPYSVPYAVGDIVWDLVNTYLN